MKLHQLTLEGKELKEDIEPIIKPWEKLINGEPVAICCEKCWMAHGKKCKCKCKGSYHGQGLKSALNHKLKIEVVE